ncbi:hypothetical protein Tco_0512263 [Tanacetum coccineum]
MTETMEQYMSKTRADYGSGVARPKIEVKDNFELKGQFLKELRTNTFSDSDHEDANEHIEKVLEIFHLFHIPNITIDQVMLRAFPVSLTGAASHWLRNKPTEPDENLYQAWKQFKELLMKCPQHYLTEMRETTADAKVAIQEMAEYSQKWHNGTSRSRSTENFDGLATIQAQLNNLGREIKKSMEDTLRKFMSESAKIHEENSNLIKEMRASMDAAIQNQGASIKTLEIQIGQMSKVLEKRGFGRLPSSTEVNLRDQVKSISTTIEAD